MHQLWLGEFRGRFLLRLGLLAPRAPFQISIACQREARLLVEVNFIDYVRLGRGQSYDINISCMSRNPGWLVAFS